MPNVKPELREQFNSQTAVLAALKAALPSADEADKPEIQSQIDIYESALLTLPIRIISIPAVTRLRLSLSSARWQGFLQTPMSLAR